MISILSVTPEESIIYLLTKIWKISGDGGLDPGQFESLVVCTAVYVTSYNYYGGCIS